MLLGPAWVGQDPVAGAPPTAPDRRRSGPLTTLRIPPARTPAAAVEMRRARKLNGGAAGRDQPRAACPWTGDSSAAAGRRRRRR